MNVKRTHIGAQQDSLNKVLKLKMAKMADF